MICSTCGSFLYWNDFVKLLRIYSSKVGYLVLLLFFNCGSSIAQEVAENNCSIVLKDFKIKIEKLIDDGLSPYQMSLKTKDTISGLKCDSETADKTIRSWKEFIPDIGPNGPDNIVYGLIKDDILFALIFDKTKNKFESYYTTFFRPSDDFLKKHPQKYPGIIWIP